MLELSSWKCKITMTNVKISSGEKRHHSCIDREFQQRNRNYKEKSKGNARDKIITTKMTNAFDRLRSRHYTTKEIISEHEKRMKTQRGEKRTVHSRAVRQYQTF